MMVNLLCNREHGRKIHGDNKGVAVCVDPLELIIYNHDHAMTWKIDNSCTEAAMSDIC